jgi:hypothetical protein
VDSVAVWGGVVCTLLIKLLTANLRICMRCFYWINPIIVDFFYGSLYIIAFEGLLSSDAVSVPVLFPSTSSSSVKQLSSLSDEPIDSTSSFTLYEVDIYLPLTVLSVVMNVEVAYV